MKDEFKRIYATDVKNGGWKSYDDAGNPQNFKATRRRARARIKREAQKSADDSATATEETAP